MKKIAIALAALIATAGVASAGSIGDFASQLQYPTTQTTKSDLDYNSTGSIKRPVTQDQNKAEQADQR